MDEPLHQGNADVAIFRLGKGLGLAEAVQAVKDALLRAKQAGTGKLLVNAATVEFGPPTTGELHGIMIDWANVGRSAVRVAIVVRQEFQSPERFGAAVARNHGLDLRSFNDEEQAMAWLAGRPDTIS